MVSRGMRARPDVDEDLVRLERVVAHAHQVWSLEPTMSLVHREILGSLKPPFDARVGAPYDGVLAGFNRLHVDTDAGCCHSVVGGAPSYVGHSRTGHQRLGGNTARVHTGPTEPLPFDHGDLTSRLGQVDRKAGT